MPKLVLIDLSSIYWAAWHATVDQPLSAAFELTIGSVLRFTSPEDYSAICCDAPPYWRKKLSAEYKAQRDAPEPNAVDQLKRVKERLSRDGFVLWESPGFEADDVIAWAALEACHLGGIEVEIVSGDKDLTQLIEPTVRMRKPSNGADLIDEAAVIAKFGVPPNRMRDLLALMGDTSDNIPGVRGVGAKTAAKLLHDFGSIDNLVANIGKLPEGKLRSTLETSLEQLDLSRRLVTLRTDVPLDFNDLFEKREPVREEPEMSEDEYDAEDNMDADEAPPDAISVPQKQEERAEKPEPETKPDALAKTNGNGIAPVSASFEQGLQPGSIGAAYKLAKGLAESRLYSKFPNAEGIWAIIIRGREMGLGALTALDSFFIVEGKPYPSAHLLIARAKGHPQCEYFQFIGGDATFAEYETKHRGNPRPTRLKYTIEQAKRASLVRDGSNWTKRPEEMLRKTCALQLARIEYPEVMQGTYAAEEMGDD